jgi:hypothetical protein
MGTTASTLQVKVSADITSFVHDMSQATRETNLFARHTSEIGRTITATSRIAGEFSSRLTSLAGSATSAGSALSGLTGIGGRAVETFSSVSNVLGNSVIVASEGAKAYKLLEVGWGKLVESGAGVIGTMGAIAAGAAVTVGQVLFLNNAWNKMMTAIHGVDLGPDHVLKIDYQNFGFGERQHYTDHRDRAGVQDVVAVTAAPVGYAAQVKLLDAEFATIATRLHQVQDGVRNWDFSLFGEWARVMGDINGSLAESNRFSADEVNKLYAMRAALQDLKAATLDFGQIGPVSTIGPNPNIIHGAPTASDLFKTTYQEGPGRKEISEKTDEVNHSVLSARDAIVTGFTETINALATLGGALVSHSTGGMIGAALGSGVGSGIGNYLGGKLGAGVGAAIGSAVLPVVGTLLGSAVGSFIGNGIGSLFGHKKAADNATDSLNKLAVAAQKVSESISNAVVGFKVQYYRYLAADATRIGVPVGLSGKQAMIYIAEMNVSAASGQDFIAQLSAAAQVTVSRGGAAGFTLAAGAATRGY